MEPSLPQELAMGTSQRSSAYKITKELGLRFRPRHPNGDAKPPIGGGVSDAKAVWARPRSQAFMVV